MHKIHGVSAPHRQLPLRCKVRRKGIPYPHVTQSVTPGMPFRHENIHAVCLIDYSIHTSSATAGVERGKTNRTYHSSGRAMKSTRIIYLAAGTRNGSPACQRFCVKISTRPGIHSQRRSPSFIGFLGSGKTVQPPPPFGTSDKYSQNKE